MTYLITCSGSKLQPLFVASNGLLFVGTGSIYTHQGFLHSIVPIALPRSFPFYASPLRCQEALAAIPLGAFGQIPAQGSISPFFLSN